MKPNSMSDWLHLTSSFCRHRLPDTGGSKNVQICVTSFMNGPLTSSFCRHRLPDTLPGYLDSSNYFAMVRTGNCDLFKCNNKQQKWRKHLPFGGIYWWNKYFGVPYWLTTEPIHACALNVAGWRDFCLTKMMLRKKVSVKSLLLQY